MPWIPCHAKYLYEMNMKGNLEDVELKWGKKVMM